MRIWDVGHNFLQKIEILIPPSYINEKSADTKKQCKEKNYWKKNVNDKPYV